MRRRVALVMVGCLAAAVTACSTTSSDATPRPATPRPATPRPATTQPATTIGGAAPVRKTAPAQKDTQVWLCKPGRPGDPCLSSMTTTVVAADGTKTVEQSRPAADPKVDCFYVYPTVSKQKGPNADLTIDPAEVFVATAQASRYSQVCRAFAPMYRQVTLGAIFGASRTAAGVIAFRDVLSAWNDYLARYNQGRGVVLIGHSQGSQMLRRLVVGYIEPDQAVRKRIVSAILLGGNVIVPSGKDVGGDFKYLGACHRASQLGCVIAFSSFDRTPPPTSLFGRARTPGEQVLCTNPAALAGGSGALDPYLPSRAVPGSRATPWLSYPDLFTGQCENVDGASWLQITDVRKPGDDRPKLVHSLPASWGLHLYDGNIALGNLVDIVRAEAAAYQARG